MSWALWVDHDTVKGQLTATGAKAVTLCGSVLDGVTVRAATGLVRIGGPGCGNTLGHVRLTRNARGVAYTDNLARTVTIVGNRGGFAYARNRARTTWLWDNR